MISPATLREIDDLLKYFDKAEKELNSLEPISASQDVLTAQLRDHKIFHDELERRQRHLSSIISKCKVMLREVCSEESDDVRSKLTNMSDQAEVICRLSSSRLQILEEKLPLATYFSMTFDRLLTWLADIELEITCIDCKPDEPVEEVKVKQDRAKAAQRLIDDYKAVVDDVVMTGHDLMSISTRYDSAGVQRQVDHVMNRYVIVRQSVRGKLALLDETVRRITVDVTVTLDSIVDDLQYLNGKAKYADPIAANPTTLRGQIAENESIVEDLQSCSNVINSVKGAIDQTLKRMSESSDDQSSECQELSGEELVSELQTLDELQTSVFTNTKQRSMKLRGAVGVADRFHNDFENTIDLLRDIRDELVAQELPGVETEVVEIQQKELKKLASEFKKANMMFDICRKTVDELAKYCDAPGLAEVEKHIEDMENLKEEIEDRIKDRSTHLDVAMERSRFFSKYYKNIMQWLPAAEEKIMTVSPVAAHPRSVKIQIEELKVLKIQLRPHHVDIENLNQYMADLTSTSPFMAEALMGRVAEINERWQLLLKEFEARETHLHDILVELGEVNHSVDDVIGFLQQIEADLQQFERNHVDPGHVILYLRKIQKELVNLDPVIARLNGVIQMSAERSGKTSASLLEKQDEMMSMYLDAQVLARDKLNELHSRLKQVKGYMGSVDDLLSWLHDFKNKLKTTEFMGVLPEEVKTQHTLIMESYEELINKEIEIQAITLNGDDMLARCREKDAKQLKAKLELLQERMRETKVRAEKRKKKMEGHMKAVEMFHKLFFTHIDWLDKAEKTLSSLKNRNKTIEKIQIQLLLHQELKKDVDFQSKIAQNVENTGTYLKYFGSKRDTVYVKNLLVGVKVRWKKLVRKVDEAGRLLQQAFREDRRFHDCWQSLLDWLDGGELLLKKYVADSGGKKKEAQKEGTKDTKIKDGDELHRFQIQMSAKHPNYYSTMRLGTSLRDQCSPDDPERDILNTMIETLRNKWNTLRSIASQRQVKLEEGLMSSGRLNDALHSLLEWLNKAQVYLEQDQLLLGDLDSVSNLIEKHKLFQQEITSRKGIVSAMLSTPPSSSELQGQLDELKNVWGQVKELSDVREVKLQESLKLAETFNDAIQVVRDWLPDAEAELKFHSIPDDEASILQLIENHEKFQEELHSQQVNIDKVKKLSEEILDKCHPSAIRFVKYYFTITQTRWEQAVSRSNQRSIKLQEALKTTRDNTLMMSELMLWLNDGHALLIMKEKDDVPNDLTVIEALSKEHLEFHEELINKSKDIDRIVKSFTGGVASSGTSPASGQSEKRAHGGRHAHLIKSSHSDCDSLSVKATALQNKWKLVLKMSTERKKKLQDALSKILELENCRNFDFDVWRQRYIAWNRANKLKFVDFFRRQDRHGTGLLTKKEFVEGIMASKFPTNETELLIVFNVFDVKRLGRIQYKTFVDAIMRPDKSIGSGRFDTKASNDSQTIDAEIEDRLSKCHCRIPFNAFKVDDGKYKFGEKDRICTVRVMNGNVYVRFGSSWMPLDEFVEKNDPCKAKVKPSSTPRSAFRNTSLTGSASDLWNLNGKSPLTPRVQTPNNRIKKLQLTPITGSQTNLRDSGKELNSLERSRMALFSRSCVNLTSTPERTNGISTTSPHESDTFGSRNSAMGLSVYQSGSTPRYRKVHGGLNINGRQSSASSSSSSSTSTWPRTESNPPGSLSNSVMSAPGGSRSQQSPTSNSTSPSTTNLRPSRRTPASTPSSTASSPSSRFPLKTFTTSRSPQRTPRSRPSTAGLTDDGASAKKNLDLKRGRQSPSSSGLFVTSRTLNL